MSDMAIRNMGHARAVRRNLNAFLSDTKPVMKEPHDVFRTERKAEVHVYRRQLARNVGGGQLDNAIRHWKKAIAGADDVLEQLVRDRTFIGDGKAPKLIGDVRAHVTDAVDELDKLIQERRPGAGRLAAAGAAIGAAALVIGFATKQ